LYLPEGRITRTVLAVPGIHAAGIDETRLVALAKDLAGTGLAVMTMALPDLMAYRITPQSTDVIEDAIAWLSRRPELAPDGRIGIVGVSFAGGLSTVAAGRPSVRDRTAFVLSFGGHADLPRVMRYLCTGEAPHVDGLETHPPHDYGVAVLLYFFADRGVVPAEQVQPLRDGVGTFLLASQLTLVDMKQANETFAKARDMVKALPEPSATYLKYVNDRNVKALGPVLLPHVIDVGGDPSLSPERASAPAAPVYLLHGADDTVIPAAESVILTRHLEGKAHVRLLLSRLITHAEVDRSAAASETLKLVLFWADVLRQ
jgi:dienelactone hydrolase